MHFTSCVISRGYDHRVPNPAMPGEFYAEVSYICAPGFDFDNDERNVKNGGEKFNKLYCSEGRWEGRVPECINLGEGKHKQDADSICPPEEESKMNCEQSCVMEKDNNGQTLASCKCHVGYTLSDEDKRTCQGNLHRKYFFSLLKRLK